MFLSTSKQIEHTSTAQKIVKKRPSVVNLISRRLHSSRPSSPENNNQGNTTVVPPHRKSSRQHAPPVDVFSHTQYSCNVEPRPSRSTSSFDSQVTSTNSNLLAPKISHRRTQSTNSSSPSYEYDDLFKTRSPMSSSNTAVERKIWPGQHRYSQEICTGELPKESVVNPLNNEKSS